MKKLIPFLLVLLMAPLAWAGPPAPPMPATVSQAEAEAGTSTALRMWTAERVKQAIAALSGGLALIDDTAGNGVVNKTWSADKIFDQLALRLALTGGTLTGGLTINHADGLKLGVASTTTGTAYFYGNAKAFPFGLWSAGADAPAIGWKLPSVMPGGANYLLTVDADGTMDYADPATLIPSNLTSFTSQTPWRLFYSNADGDVVEMPFGDANSYLKSQGAELPPTWGTPGEGGFSLAEDAQGVFNNTSGLGLNPQNANKVWAGPGTGADADPTFRQLVAADIPGGTNNTEFHVDAANNGPGWKHDSVGAPGVLQAVGTDGTTPAPVKAAGGEFAGPLSTGTADLTVTALGTLNDAVGAVSTQVATATCGAGTATFNITGCTTGYECKRTLYLTNPGAGTIAWQYGGAARTGATLLYAAGTAPSYTASGLDIIVVTTIDGGATLTVLVAAQDVKAVP
jgi:hypothetical protein